MNIYRFVLERYDRSKKNRYTCPCCGHKREFTRYIDLMGTFIFPEYVGKCNRANNCAYHYPPAIFFRDNPEALKDLMNTGNGSGNHPVPLVPRLMQPIQASCIEKELCKFHVPTNGITRTISSFSSVIKSEKKQ